MSARVLLLLASLILLIGCQPRPPAQRLMDDYLARLSRVLDQPIPEFERQSPPRKPRARELQVDIEPLSIGVLDYWGFRRCGLAEILAERNSVLGRVMPPSQHLHMDGRLLIQLEHCREVLEDETLSQLAGELREQKLEQWPARYWNATVASPDLRRFWSPSTRPLAPGKAPSYREIESALAYLGQLPARRQLELWPSLSELERHYERLGRDRLGGKLLQSLQLGNDYLEAASQMLEQARAERSLCPHGQPLQELEYARNVMTTVFIANIQPWMAAVERRSRTTLAAYNDLVKAQDQDLQARIAPYQQDINHLHQQFQQRNRDHVEQWQRLFERCGGEAVEAPVS